MPSLESISHVRRDLLDRPVREYADNLEEQVLVILRKYGIKDIPGFERAVREKMIPFKVAERVRDLLALFRDAVKKNEAPTAPTISVTVPDRSVDGIKFEREIVVDLQERLAYWKQFFISHGLPELARALPERFKLTDDQIETIKEKLKEGFAGVMILPDPDLLRTHTSKLLFATTNGYPETGFFTDTRSILDAFAEQPGDLRHFIISKTPDVEDARNFSSGKSYLLMHRDEHESSAETIDQSADNLYTSFKASGNTGFTLEEYFVFQRAFYDENKTHPDSEYTTQLLGSHIMDMGRWKWLEAGWTRQGQLGLYCAPVYSVHDQRGARDAFVMEIG